MYTLYIKFEDFLPFYFIPFHYKDTKGDAKYINVAVRVRASIKVIGNITIR